MSWDLINQDVDPNMIYFNIYSSTLSQPIVTQTVAGGTIAPVTTINGNSGTAVTGPVITLSGGVTGYGFVGAGGTVTFTVSNAATARGAISAAKSGANADINTFSALTGNTGVNAWTGTPNGATQATYPATVASVGYVQAETQGLMDKMQDVTEFMMFLVAALLAPGVVET